MCDDFVLRSGAMHVCMCMCTGATAQLACMVMVAIMVLISIKKASQKDMTNCQRPGTLTLDDHDILREA